MLHLHHQVLSPETLHISYSKNLVASSAKTGPTKHAKNMLVNFMDFTSTYIMTIRKYAHGHVRKLKCFQTNTILKIKLLIKQKIGSLVPLTDPHNLSKVPQ